MRAQILFLLDFSEYEERKKNYKFNAYAIILHKSAFILKREISSAMWRSRKKISLVSFNGFDIKYMYRRWWHNEIDKWINASVVKVIHFRCESGLTIWSIHLAAVSCAGERKKERKRNE